MRAILHITENTDTSSSLSARDVRDPAHARRLLLQSYIAMVREGQHEHQAPEAKLQLLRGFLDNLGCQSADSVRYLLGLLLFQLEDEDDAKRFVMPHPLLPILQRPG